MMLSSAVGGMDPGFAPQQPQTVPAPQGLSKGQLIAGIFADALAGAQGRPGAFAAQQGQLRQEERQMAQWGLKRKADLQDFEQQQVIKARYDKPDVSPMMRDAQAWAMMTPEQKAAYREAQAAKPQFIPDGLGGGQWAMPPASSASTPPITEDLWNKGVPMGGAAPQAPAPFLTPGRRPVR